MHDETPAETSPANTPPISEKRDFRKRSRRLPEFLRPAEADALVEAAPPGRDRLIVLVGLGAGLRCSEIVSLRIEDVDLAEQQVFIRRSKGDKDRYVAIPGFLCEALREWIGARRIGWVFPSPRNPSRPMTTRAVQYLMERLKEAAGIVRRCNPHVMRHSYACDLLRNGADVTELQRLLGHASPNSTFKYLHCDTSRLAGVVARLSLGAGKVKPPDAETRP